MVEPEAPVEKVKAELPKVAELEAPVEQVNAEAPKVEEQKIDPPVYTPPKVEAPVVNPLSPGDLLLPYSDNNQEFKKDLEPNA